MTALYPRKLRSSEIADEPGRGSRPGDRDHSLGTRSARSSPITTELVVARTLRLVP